jgi:hypothetical protein
MKSEAFPEVETLSRRSFLTAALAAAVAGLVGVTESSEAEAQERQFTTFHHQRRVSHPRSHTRGSRRHRRVARVHRRGPAKPLDTPAQ